MDLLVAVGQDERAVGNGYLIHDGVSLTLEKFCGLLAEALHLKGPHRHIPYWVAYGTAVVMEGIWKWFSVKTRPLLTTYIVKSFGSQLQFSIDKAARELDFQPKYSFEEGFAATVKWLKTEYGDLLEKGKSRGKRNSRH